MSAVPETITRVQNQVVVQIEIQNGEVYVSPEEVTIYHVWDEAHATPGLAHEVRWMAKGHGPGQYVHIVGKSGEEMFDGNVPQPPGKPVLFEIPAGYNSIASGPPKLRPNQPSGHLHWYYEVLLVEKGGKVLKRSKDPDIIIKDDP